MAKKIILVIFIGLLIFSVIYALSGKKKYTTSSDQAYHTFLAGEELMKKLYYTDAIPEFEKAVKIDTNFAMAYAMLAELYNMHDRKDDAQESIQKAVSLMPLVTEKEQLLISISQGKILKDTELSKKGHDELILKYPNSLEAHMYKASHFMEDHDFENAIIEYEQIIKDEPDFALAYNMLGYLNYYVRNFDEALLNIKKYSIVAGKQANPHDSYGEILMYLGRYDDAIKEFETANRIKPDLDFVLGHLGHVNREIGRYRDAIGYFERAKEFARNEGYAARAEEQIAYTRYIHEEKKQALELFDNLYKEHSDWYSVVAYRGIVAAGLEKYDIADSCIDDLNKMLEKADSSEASQNYKNEIIIYRKALLGKIALMKEDYNEAINVYKDIIELVSLPNLIMMKALLGKSYMYAGELNLAEEVLLTNLDDNPNHPYTLFMLSKVYREMGSTEKQKQTLLTYLSVMSGADEDIREVVEARQQLDSLIEM